MPLDSNVPRYCSDNATFMLVYDREHRTIVIRFLPCGIISHHREDIRHRYCARCHRFIEREAA